MVPPTDPAHLAQTEYNVTVHNSGSVKIDVTVVHLLTPTRYSRTLCVDPSSSSLFDLSGYVLDADNINFRMEPDLPEFSLNSESRQLMLRQPLDFEQKES